MSSVAGRVLMIFKGDYDSATTYKGLDVVLYQGLSYVAKGTTTGNAPSNTTYWQKLLDIPTQVDNAPTQNSNNLVKSGGTYTAIDAKADKTDAFLTTDSTETIADADYIPFYDTSASAKKKTLWSSLVSAVTAIFTGATSLTAGTKGTVPAPSAGDDGKFLKGDGSWANPPTPSVMIGADGTNAGASGLVPAPNATDNTKFLRGDGVFATVTTSDMTGATSQSNGVHGLVPAPTTTDVNKFLKGDGTFDNDDWGNIKNKPFETLGTTLEKRGVWAYQGDLETVTDIGFNSTYVGTTDIQAIRVKDQEGYSNEPWLPFTECITKTGIVLSTSQDTTVTITEPENFMPSDASYDIFTSVYGINPKSVAVSSVGSGDAVNTVMTIVFPKQSSATTISLKVYFRWPYSHYSY